MRYLLISPSLVLVIWKDYIFVTPCIWVSIRSGGNFPNSQKDMRKFLQNSCILEFLNSLWKVFICILNQTGNSINEICFSTDTESLMIIEILDLLSKRDNFHYSPIKNKRNITSYVRKLSDLWTYLYFGVCSGYRAPKGNYHELPPLSRGCEVVWTWTTWQILVILSC